MRSSRLFDFVDVLHQQVVESGEVVPHLDNDQSRENRKVNELFKLDQNFKKPFSVKTNYYIL